MTNPVVERAADAFAAALRDWRVRRGLSKKQLAVEMGFDPSYVSHVEARRHRPTEDFARRAENVLRAGGLIWQRFRDFEEARFAATASARHGPADALVPDQRRANDAGLIVEHESASLSYVDGLY